jgi:hypothetical protein
MTTATEFRYTAPDAFTRTVMNPLVNRLTGMGISVWGSRELRVRGRVSGEWRSTPVNLLTIEGERYLLAPRGVTQWVRNLRVSREGELRVGRRVEQFRATELADDVKLPILRAYLQRWGWEVGKLFEGLDKHSSDEQLIAAAGGFPVFRVTAA